ncbi:uncharacterized protein [Haliotis asinina]|uniref:uncharacterized protein n=1 Tax=Haliotis asinina TaxID=109174 RepID=UPI003531871E
MPLLPVSRSECPPADQNMPLMSPHLFSPPSPVWQRVPARLKQPGCCVVTDRPECCESHTVEQVEPGQGEILAGSLLCPCGHTDGGTSMSKVISQSDVRNFDEDSEVGSDSGGLNDISQTGGGGADGGHHAGRTTDQVVPDVTQSGCFVTIVHEQTGSESVDDDNILILSKCISSETRDDLRCESQVNVLPCDVKPCIENQPGVQGHVQPQCVEDQCVQPHCMEGQCRLAAFHSYKHAVQAARYNTFEEYLMNLPQECVISSGHVLSRSDTLKAGALCKGWTSDDEGMTIEQRGSNVTDSSYSQGQWQPVFGVTAVEEIPTTETGEWQPQRGDTYLRREDLQAEQVSPDLREVSDVTGVDQGMRSTLEEVYEKDELLLSCVDAFSGDFSPSKDYYNKDLLPPCVKSCHLEDLLWPDVAERNDARLSCQVELPYGLLDSMEVKLPYVEHGNQLLECVSPGAESLQDVDPEFSGAWGYNPRSLQVLHNIHEEQRLHFYSANSGKLDPFENTFSFRSIQGMLNDFSTEHHESLFRQCPNMHSSHTESWSSHIRQSPGEHLSLLEWNSFYKQACHTLGPKLSQGATEMLQCAHETANGRIPSGQDTANRRIPDGLNTASGRIFEGHNTASGSIFDGHNTASRKIFDGQDTASGRIFDGHDTASGRIFDGHDTASGKIFDSQDTASGRIVDGQDTASGRIFDSHNTASGRIFDGHNTASGRILSGPDKASGRICKHQQDTGVYFSGHMSMSPRLKEHSDCGSQDSFPIDSPVLTEGQKEMGYRVKRILVKPRWHSSESEIPPLEIRVIESLSFETVERKEGQCSSKQCATVSQVIGCTLSSTVPAMTTGSHIEMSSESSMGDGRAASIADGAAAVADIGDVEGGGLDSALASLAAQCEVMRARKKRASAPCEAKPDVTIPAEYGIKRPSLSDIPCSRPIPFETTRSRTNMGNNCGTSSCWKQRDTLLKNEREKSPVKTTETTVCKSDEKCHLKEQRHEHFGKQLATVIEVQSNTAATGIGLPSCRAPTHKRENRDIHHKHTPGGLKGTGQGSKQKKGKILSRFSSRGVQLHSSLSRSHSKTMVKNVSDFHRHQQENGPHATDYHTLKLPREFKSRNNGTVTVCPVRASAEVVPLPSPPFSVQRCVEEAARMGIKNNKGYVLMCFLYTAESYSLHCFAEAGYDELIS